MAVPRAGCWVHRRRSSSLRPSIYLHQFADSDGFVVVLDIQTTRMRRRHVNAVAFRERFYNMEILGRQVSIEPWLAQVENRAIPIVRRLATDPQNIRRLSEEEEDDLARFMGAQWLRVPAFREWNDRSMELMRNQMRPLVTRQLSQFDGMTENDVWEQLGLQEDATGARDTALTALMLAETQGLANVLQAMAWTVGEVVGPGRRTRLIIPWHVSLRPLDLGGKLAGSTHGITILRSRWEYC